MLDLNRPIGELLSDSDDRIVGANESERMLSVAGRMQRRLPNEYLSQIPLWNSEDKIRCIVSGNGLAQWAVNGCPDVPAHDYSEPVKSFPKETPLGDNKFIQAISSFGYAVVTGKDDRPIVILTYTDIIPQLIT